MAEVDDQQDTNEITEQKSSTIKQEPSREQLLNTAIKFLQNPKVQSSPLIQKKAFLQSKGLTNEEIEQALELAGVNKQIVTENNKLEVVPYNLTTVSVSNWTRAKDISFIVLVICGATYGLYQLIRKYIFPHFNIQSEVEDLNKMNKKLDDVQTSLNQMLEKLCSSIQELRCDIKENQQKLDVCLHSQNNQIIGTPKTKDDSALQEMKKEIASLKSLLLNRHSFPPPPTLQAIPSWQIKDLQTSTDNEIREDENDKNVSPDNIITSNGSRSWELVSGGDSEETETEANSSGV